MPSLRTPDPEQRELIRRAGLCPWAYWVLDDKSTHVTLEQFLTHRVKVIRKENDYGRNQEESH